MTALYIFASDGLAQSPRRPRTGDEIKTIQLPEPNKTGKLSLEAVLNNRRSTAQFADKQLSSGQIGQLAWAGQGIIDRAQNIRTAPSPGDIHPIELYFFTSDGLSVYIPESHSLKVISSADLRKQLSAASFGLGPVEDAACDIVIAGSSRKLAAEYGNKAPKLLFLEAGFISENIHLQAVSLGLAAMHVEKFEIRNVAKLCEMRSDYEPVIILSIGYPFVPQTSQDETKVTDKSSKKAIIVVPPFQFADSELLDIQRIFNDSGIVDVVASSKIGALQGAFGGIAGSEITIDRINIKDYDALILIGGPGAVDYFNNPAVLNLVKEASATNKIIGAISSAPMILANAGILRGIRATCIFQQREQLKKQGAQFTGASVETDGSIITANDSSAAVQFARAIVSKLNANALVPRKAP